jgi:hypothetical protein
MRCDPLLWQNHSIQYVRHHNYYVVSVRTSGPSTLQFVPLKQHLGCCKFCHEKKWVWPSVNGCQCKNPISTKTNFSTHAKPGQTRQCAQKIIENNDTLWNKSAVLNTVTTPI